MVKRKTPDDTCVVVACYDSEEEAFRIGQRWIIAGKQRSRSGRTWQIILKPFAKKEKK